MRRAWNCAIGIVALMTVPVLASAAAPAEGETSLPQYCEIAVDESFAGQRKFVRAWAADGVRDGLDRVKIDAAEVAKGRVLVVEIGGRAFAYTGKVDVRGDDDEARVFECKCSSDDLVAKVAGEVAAVAPGLVATAAVTDAPVDEPASAPTTTTQPAVVDEAPVGKKRMGKGGRAGAVLIGVGAAALIGGVVLLALGERSKDDGDVDRDRTTDYRPAGGASLGVGAALVITGAVLVAVDKKRARSGGRMAMLPTVGSRSWGFAITGRF